MSVGSPSKNVYSVTTSPPLPLVNRKSLAVSPLLWLSRGKILFRFSLNSLVVQTDAYIAQLPTVLVIPLTSQTATTRFPATLPIQPDAQNGLSVPSVALIFQMRVVDKRFIKERLGRLDPAIFARLISELDKLLGR